MMQTAGLSRRFIVIASTILVAIWLWFAFHTRSPRQLVWDVYRNGWNGDAGIDVFDFPPLDSEALKDVCAATTWNSSLIFTCDNNHGGVANVRNMILNCVRYTIAAGGALVLPNIAPREQDASMGEYDEEGEEEVEKTVERRMAEGETTLNRRHGPSRHGMEFFFDMNHFADSLRTSCPELVLVRHLEQTASNRRRGLLPESLFPDIPTSGIEHPEEWPSRLKQWIDQYMSAEPESEAIIIDLEPSFLHYPTHSDGHAFAHSFGNILKFRSDVRALATKTIAALATTYDLPVNISRHGLLKPSFLGAHLATENPIFESRSLPRHEMDIPFEHYDAQSKAYLALAASHQIRILYAASAQVSEMEQFASETPAGTVVTYKEDLLRHYNNGNDLKHLKNLKADQRAIVDWLVLTRAQHFAGVGHSPLSWNVALARQQWGVAMGGKLEGDVWNDGGSTLFGVREDYVRSSACMWN